MKDASWWRAVDAFIRARIQQHTRDAKAWLREQDPRPRLVRALHRWNSSPLPRPVVNVKIDGRPSARLGVDALLDFSVNATLEGEPLTDDELQKLLESAGGAAFVRGKWVEVDREKFGGALHYWKDLDSPPGKTGLSFFESVRLLAGIVFDRDAGGGLPRASRAWVEATAGDTLKEILARLRSPEFAANGCPAALRTELRPYQQVGLDWLRFVTGLGLGACLADDMGLGKTVQVLALLLDQKERRDAAANSNEPLTPNLLVLPTSLIANWKSEIDRFAPTLTTFIAHPSELPAGIKSLSPEDVGGHDLVITSYGILARTEWLRRRPWNLVILDEAQAIKNARTRQSRAVKELPAAGRIVLTGTPVENRLSDLWSIFDFLNPGLLGNAKTFANFLKQLESRKDVSYQPLRTLVQPYILRRLKSDKRVIADLPEKTEVNAYCWLSRQQAALYEQSVRDLATQIKQVGGIQRRGLVLAQLTRLKQICNHPSQVLDDGTYDPRHSGKFQRLQTLCRALAERQEKVLVFTQFRELCDPLAKFLEAIFGRPGLLLHGDIAVSRRQELIDRFQQESGPPFFVLSLKTGGTGVNLTAATQVVHFDRWWNPAVESQATDRTFRIGQKRNVLVHKFICRGTIEEKIDALIAEKVGLAADVLDGGEALITEMDDSQLLEFLALDVRKAMISARDESSITRGALPRKPSSRVDPAPASLT